MQRHAGRRGVAEEELRGAPRLSRSRAVGAEDDPVDAALSLGEKPQNRPATADLDVVGMRAETQEAQGRAGSG